jgi:protein TonB
MAKESKPDHFIKQPTFKGGAKAIQQHVQYHLKYPEEALNNKIEGTVHVRYDIDFKGNVVDGKVIKGIGHGCDEEAIRIVKLMKFDVVKGPRKLKIVYHKDIQIHFKLPKSKPIIVKPPTPQSPGLQIQYNVVRSTSNQVSATKTKPGQKQNQTSTSYTFTIKI